MLKNKRAFTILLILLFCIAAGAVAANKQNWRRKQVNWRSSGQTRIKAVKYPQHKPLPTLSERKNRKPPRKKILTPAAAARMQMVTQQSAATAPLIANVIDSPPVDGFIPWIVVSVTDEREDEMDMNFEAATQTSVVGDYLPYIEPYVIGVLDTGASIHVMGYVNAFLTGIFTAYPSLLTPNSIAISGVTGTVYATTTQPLGIFVDGLGAIDSNGLLTNPSGMVGQTNISIAAGEYPGSNPDLITAIGAPMAVYFTTVINNEQQITIDYDGNDVNAPDIRFYDHNDPNIPTYSNIVPLELRPLGAYSVQYIPSLDVIGLEFEPSIPSTIIGNLSQSLFFVHSVDLYEGENIAFDKDRFMFDTGAQVTVIGSRVAARLSLHPSEAEFEVEIVGVTGESIMAPGFYIDSIEIPAMGQWLSFTNIPVILLDISSPEGGTLDGIIGMNLFVDYNLVLRGGGIFLQDDPTLEFQAIALTADIAPEGGDGTVNFLDLRMFAESWLATASPQSPNWNPDCDISPQPVGDGIINLLDLAILAKYWLK